MRSLAVLERLGATVIVVDDGSTDGSSNLLIKLRSEMNSNIQIIKTLNQGAGPARLLSIEKAETDFIFFVDIDDLPLALGLQELFQSLKLSDADLAIGNYQVSQENDVGLMPLKVNHLKIVSLRDHRDEFKGAMGWWRYIYKREFLLQQDNKVGRAFENFGDKKFVLDDLYWMNHLCSQDLKVLVSPDSLLVYEYNLPSENAKQRWDSYLKQVSYLPIATQKYINFINANNCNHQVEWMIETALRDTWNHMPLLPFYRYYKSYFGSFALTSELHGGTTKAHLDGAFHLIIAILKRLTRTVRELKPH